MTKKKRKKMWATESRSHAVWASQMQSDSRALTTWATGTADVWRQKIWEQDRIPGPGSKTRDPGPRPGTQDPISVPKVDKSFWTHLQCPIGWQLTNHFRPICKDPDVRTQVPGRKYGDECPCVDEVDDRYIGHSFKSITRVGKSGASIRLG